MRFINWKFGAAAEEQLTPLAQQVAQRSQLEVSRRLIGLSSEMSRAEARGYIRTRAAVVVHREVNLLLQQHRLRAAERVRVIELATDLLVDDCLNAAGSLARCWAA
jgi:hypothetical protein